MLGDTLNRIRGGISAKNVLGSAAGSFGLPAGIGLVASGGEPRGAWEGLKGGLAGGLSGGLKGAIGFGALGALAGVGLASGGGRMAMLQFARKYGLGIGERAASGIVKAGFVQNASQAPRFARAAIMEVFRKRNPAYNVIGTAALAGFSGGMLGGSALGGVTGAWAAGKNVRASIAYNQFGGIGL